MQRDRPWAMVGVDLCESQGRTLVVLVDCYSNFVEVEISLKQQVG